MKFRYTPKDLFHAQAADKNTFLLTNGLGGYMAVSAGYGAPRCDQGILVAAVKAPNERISLVHRLSETLQVGEEQAWLSSQQFADGKEAEDGLRCLNAYSYEYVPCWQYEMAGVKVVRQCAMEQGENTVAVVYQVENRADVPCKLTITPWFKFAPKEEAVQQPVAFAYENGKVAANGYTLFLHTGETVQAQESAWQINAYPEDAKDGRPASGFAGSCCRIEKTVPGGQTATFEVVFSTEEKVDSGAQILQRSIERMQQMEEKCGFADPAARQLVLSADAFIARRDSTNGKTILAGYPLFSDWGRDTMIALPGCCLATGRFDDAKSILRTFLAYEKEGLVPNLFPEGGQAPMYNTVDAALLLIDSVWQYVERTGDWEFAKEAYPTMERIIACYRRGTHHGIGMDIDGLIYAGQGLDQVTWMDVCVQGILPTPRHGKPVEINAYWYNALKIMDIFAQRLGQDRKDYESLAETVKKSFREKFYMPHKGYLKDVLSDTDADTQIRCNQIWALSMGFTMLDAEEERNVLQTVRKHLHTPCGLRTLSPEDTQYHGYYGGPQLERDMAYHQGTTWVFPMGAYYRAYLKVYHYSEEAIAAVKQELAAVEGMMRQGCAGQLPEIYDGDHPYEGKGCFAQAWSVGEMLRVYEVLERGEKTTC